MALQPAFLPLCDRCDELLDIIQRGGLRSVEPQEADPWNRVAFPWADDGLAPDMPVRQPGRHLRAAQDALSSQQVRVRGGALTFDVPDLGAALLAPSECEDTGLQDDTEGCWCWGFWGWAWGGGEGLDHGARASSLLGRDERWSARVERASLPLQACATRPDPLSATRLQARLLRRNLSSTSPRRPEPIMIDEANLEQGSIPALRASLEAKRQRLLERPLIARLADPLGSDRMYMAEDPFCFSDDVPELFQVLSEAIEEDDSEQDEDALPPGWREDPATGGMTFPILIDYEDLWRNADREVLETVSGTVENHVTFLTDEQRMLLECSPAELFALSPPPETAELTAFRTQRVGGVERVVELSVDKAPVSLRGLRHVAIIPNLIPLERQLRALSWIKGAAVDGPLAPLQRLVGLDAGLPLSSTARDVESPSDRPNLDQHQAHCVELAGLSPHFTLVHGPPGSGKTTAILNILREALTRGERCLVVSPTHSAVDNVIEKLTATPRDGKKDVIEAGSLPVRYAARKNRLTSRALEYWVGPKKQHRAGTIARRLERSLVAKSPLAGELFARVDDDLVGEAPLSMALTRVERVLCGTPIGLLSYERLKKAGPAEFDLLVVDEVSKMTLPEFLAIAVMARRWVLVGDPQQLPPFNACEENATTLDDVLSPELELVCSIAALVEKERLPSRREMRLIVIAEHPDSVVRATLAHFAEVGLREAPPVRTLDHQARAGVVVCLPGELHEAATRLNPLTLRDRGHNPAQTGGLRLLVSRGITVPRPAFASGLRFVEPRDRAQAMLFTMPFHLYHAQPWARAAGQKLIIEGLRNGIVNYLPSESALAVLEDGLEPDTVPVRREALLLGIAERYALNAVSVYDWLAGIPEARFDVSPLTELHEVMARVEPIRRAVSPYIGVLRLQYRMHPSLSRVPRELFYFNEALQDGQPGRQGSSRVRLLQVSGGTGEENNQEEAVEIERLLRSIGGSAAAHAKRQTVMIITPYRAQERLLNAMVERLLVQEVQGALEIEVCTLDRCQGREADYVFVSLVKDRATLFMDMPKRWNVALTRAKDGLFIVGNIHAFREEAHEARREAAWRGNPDRPRMSLLARIIETYSAITPTSFPSGADHAEEVTQLKARHLQSRGRDPLPARSHQP